MKYIKQFMIIIMITFIGECMNRLIPLPIPASIYGMVILYVCLLTNIIHLTSVKETGKLLVEIMPLMFIPAGVGLLESWDVLRPVCIPFIAITAVSTVAVMAVSGRLTQHVIRRSGKKVDKDE
ncbi:MAG: CidA/LrgA family protein [Clostridiales bacterium]|nr:CidA/LrgA family protein [Clostridiales bacterium]